MIWIKGPRVQSSISFAFLIFFLGLLSDCGVVQSSSSYLLPAGSKSATPNFVRFGRSSRRSTTGETVAALRSSSACVRSSRQSKLFARSTSTKHRFGICSSPSTPYSIKAQKSGMQKAQPDQMVFWRSNILIYLDTELEQGLDLPSHPKLYRGQLKNGLRYPIFPNKVGQNRFEAHTEVHTGSIDEVDEQGIAHMIEHVAFLGSKKRERLLGNGEHSNAYTDSISLSHPFTDYYKVDSTFAL